MNIETTTTLSLSHLHIGQSATIDSIDLGLDAQVRERLLVLGFVPGSLISAVRRAPLGDPTEFEVRGSRISLRKSETQFILIS